MSWHRKLQCGLLFHSLSLFFALANSELVNITVDDQLGDPTTGLVPQYLPDDSTVWHVGSPTEDCPECNVTPGTLELSQVHNKTWHDSTPLDSPIPTTITVHFTGSAVYVFNIIPNTLPEHPITLTNITFSIDGSNPYIFLHEPDQHSNTILYNQLVYHNTGLEDGPHTLTMTVGHLSLILFDYLLYTQDSNTTSPSTTSTSTNASQSSSSQPSSSASASARSSNTPIGVIAGAVVGGVILLSGVVFGAFLLGRRHAHSKTAQPRPRYGAFPRRPVDLDATPPSVTPRVDSDGAHTHNLLDRTSNVSGQVVLRPTPVVADGALAECRSELTQRLENLQRTRSILSSQSPTLAGPSRSEFSGEGGIHLAMQKLETEISQIRGMLAAALNVRLADCGLEGQLEPLPEYVE